MADKLAQHVKKLVEIAGKVADSYKLSAEEELALEQDEKVTIEDRISYRFTVETVCMIIHVVDRYLFGLVGPSKRGQAIQVVADACLDALLTRTTLDEKSFNVVLHGIVFGSMQQDLTMDKKALLWAVLDSRNQSYGQCKELYGEPMQGTALWQYGALMAEACGRSGKVGFIMPGYLSGTQSIPSAATPKLLEDLAELADRA